MKCFCKRALAIFLLAMVCCAAHAGENATTQIDLSKYKKVDFLSGIVNPSGNWVPGLSNSSGNSTAPLSVDHPGLAGRKVLQTTSDHAAGEWALYRSEIATDSWGSSPYTLRYNNLYMIEVETLVMAYTQPSGDEALGSILQVHATPPTRYFFNKEKNKYVYDIDWSYTTGSDPFALAIKKGKYYVGTNRIPRTYALNTAWSHPSDAANLQKTQREAGSVELWTSTTKKSVNWKIFVRFASNDKGLVEVWKDGAMVTSYTGANMDLYGVPGDRVVNGGTVNEYVRADNGQDANSSQGNGVAAADFLSPHVHLKLGVYGHKLNGPRRVLYDNLKIWRLEPLSVTPTAEPTLSPTPVSSGDVTPTPTSAPSATPAVSPTNVPSTAPTSQPTSLPTLSPTGGVSVMPSGGGSGGGGCSLGGSALAVLLLPLALVLRK